MRRLLLAAILPLAACGNSAGGSPGIPGSGSGPARSYRVADFTGVEVTGPDDVQISTGTGFSVRAEGDPGVLDKIRITKDGSRLRIARAEGFHFGLGRPTKVFVTMPRISDVSLRGSGDVEIDHVTGDQFDAAGSGSGDLTVHAAKLNNLHLAVSGSGDMAFSGEARSLQAAINGSGDIDARHLTVNDANVSVSGSGDLNADVKGAANVNLSGSGDVDLGDAARCQIAKAGSGSVRCGR